MSEIYNPAEDSYFFAEFLKKYFKGARGKIKYLDMGSGSGILAETAIKFLGRKNVFAVDINPDSVKQLKKKNINAIKSNLFKNVNGKFDAVSFNAPYLPRDEREPIPSRIYTTGGKRGDEISIKFLKQAKKHLNRNGKIFLLISTLTPTDRIKNFDGKIVARKKIDFEELKILEFE
ncbi:MAG: methyltransferase [Nanoarchaeota archaeon]|nr:methyltransferase [Nanoarchaeota archaeon]